MFSELSYPTGRCSVPMNTPCILQGRMIGPDELLAIRRLCAAQLRQSRYQLSRRLLECLVHRYQYLSQTIAGSSETRSKLLPKCE